MPPCVLPRTLGTVATLTAPRDITYFNMARLTKRHVEDMMSSYDTDPARALLTAMRIVLNRPDIEWNNAVELLPTHFPADALHRKDTQALDQLLTHLAECRDLQET